MCASLINRRRKNPLTFCQGAIAAVFWAVWVSLGQAPGLWAETTVNTRWGDPDYQYFPPDKPPGDLPAGKDADAAPRLDRRGNYAANWNSETNTYTIIEDPTIDLEGHTHIRLPENAPANLREHEDTHARLDKYEFERNAKRKMQDAMRGFKGMTFTGIGNTDPERQANAKAQAEAELNRRGDRALNAILQQMNALGSKFDKLTDDNRSPTISNAEGEKQAKKEQERAPEPGSKLLQPQVPKTSSVGDPALVRFDDATQRVVFGEPMLIDNAPAPFDPILNRGLIHIDPMFLIGTRTNGSISLSDTAIRITDATSGQILLDGFVLEPAYMPSTLPGFAGMIQGYLDVPPDYAGGLDNLIGSPWLHDIQQARDEEELICMWFYAYEPMFDTDARSLIPDSGVIGALKIGVGVPSPTGLEIFSLALGIGLLRRRGCGQSH